MRLESMTPQRVAGLLEAERRYRSLFEHSRDAIYVAGPDGRLLDANPALLELLGHDRAGLLALDAAALHAEAEARDRFLAELAATGTVRDFEARLLRSDGRELICLLSSVAHLDEHGRVAGYQGIIHDITDRRRSEERLRHAALHDALTQLPNRGFFTDRLSRLLARLRWRPDYRFAVLFIDLDRFKLINDSLGHRAGDDLLVAISERLTASVRPEDIVARLGGDEFAILLVDLPTVGEALMIANRIQEALRHPFDIRGHEIYATASLGIALSTTGYSSPDEILRDADTAMYEAKGQATEKVIVFNETLHARAVSLLETETALRRALERGEFVLHYQPIVALHTRAIIGFEALLRWDHPERGLVPAAEFLDVAEETGLIVRIGQYALWEACRAVRGWRAEARAQGRGYGGAPLPFVSVNISPRQLLVPNFAGQVQRTLEEAGLEGAALRLEIPETALSSHAETAHRTLRELKALGVQLCLDDFGTSYTSIGHLQELAMDVVKIDRSFVSRMRGLAGRDDDMVRTILLLARRLGLAAIAEGVETAGQALDLAGLGCAHAQGYFFSRPVSGAEARALLLDGTAPDEAEALDAG